MTQANIVPFGLIRKGFYSRAKRLKLSRPAILLYLYLADFVDQDGISEPIRSKDIKYALDWDSSYLYKAKKQLIEHRFITTNLIKIGVFQYSFTVLRIS